MPEERYSKQRFNEEWKFEPCMGRQRKSHSWNINESWNTNLNVVLECDFENQSPFSPVFCLSQ